MDQDHEHEHGLNEAVYNDIVTAACEAATLAALRAVQSQAVNPSQACSGPVPPDYLNSDGNKSETGILVAFEHTCPHSLTGCIVMTPS